MMAEEKEGNYLRVINMFSVQVIKKLTTLVHCQYIICSEVGFSQYFIV